MRKSLHHGNRNLHTTTSHLLFYVRRTPSDFANKVYTITKKIPKGKVATYDQVATFVSTPRAAIAVGRALHNLLNNTKHIPWQRVVNHQGYITTTCLEHPPELQKALLESEGVLVAQKNNMWWIDLEKYLWCPKKTAQNQSPGQNNSPVLHALHKY